MSINDYFMVEVEKTDKDPETGKRLKRTMMEYEFDASMEESYHRSLFKNYKRQVEERYFNFIIVDAIFDNARVLGDFWSFAKSKGFQVGFSCGL
jgi:YLP motif-containing protein 1